MKRYSSLLGVTLLFLTSVAPAYAEQRFYATLTGAQQAPAVASSGAGSGTVLLNTAETQITVNLTFSGLTSAANASHIHGPAAVGANAGVLFPFSGVPAATSGSIPEQTFTISAGQVTQLKAGLFYFNIHSDNFPGGEIRGQILKTPFVATLSGGAQAPPISSPGTGTGTVLLNAAEDQITVDMSFANLTSPANAAHIHGPAAVGSNAGVLFPFSGVPAATSGTIPEQTFAITAGQVADLKAGLYYFNIHTDANGGGEIRGQILIARKFSATLSGGAQVPPVISSGTGTGVLLLNATEDQITVDMSFANLTSAANTAHIHGAAPVGGNAGVLFPFGGVPAATSGGIPEQTFSITPSQGLDLKAGLYYFNVHSDNFPGGEIRGQIGAVPLLTVAKADTGTSGTVTSSPAGITCGADCAEAYDSGTQVTLTSGAPPSGSFFAGWSGGGCTGAAACLVTMTADAAVTATFSPTAFTFTDDPLTAGQAAVKAVHVLELRQAINTLRASSGLAPFAFTDPTLSAGTTSIVTSHLAELRTALNAVYTKLSRALSIYTDPTVTAGVTVVKAVHIAELRLAVRLIE